LARDTPGCIESIGSRIPAPQPGKVTLRNEIKQLDAALRGEIKQLDVKIEQIRSDLARDLKDLEYRMTIKLGTMMVVAIAAMATLVKPL